MHRGRRAPPRFRVSFAPRNLRFTLAGVALGITIGSVSVLFALGKRTDDAEASVVDRRTHKQPSEALQHEALRYGAPSSANVLVRAGYVASYDYRTRNASWVLEHLTKDSLRVSDNSDNDDAPSADRTKSSFTTDALVPVPFRVHPNVYLKSGYDKGHLAPARDMATSQHAMDESFLMTNVSPQVGVGFNRGYWARLEGFVRHLTRHFDDVYVVTGPLFLPTQSKKTGAYHIKYAVVGTPPDAVAVPTHFFKVVLARTRDGAFATAGFVLPNRAISEKQALTTFLTPIDTIEKAAGLLFFDKLNTVEKRELCKETSCSLAKAYRRAAIAVDK